MKKKITRLAALLLVFAMIFAFAACKDDTTEPETTLAAGEVENTEADATEAGSDAAADATEAVSGDDTTAVSEESTAAETETDAQGNAVETAPQAPAAKKPSTTAEIVKYYNDATAKAFNAKAGFKKYRVCGNEKMDSNAIVNQFKDVIYGFMGIGAENAFSETVVKGKWEADAKKHYLRKSTLTAADVSSATCTENGGNYVITMNVKPGTTSASKGSIKNNAPIDKCGICVGDEDKSYYDHKRASVIYDAIDDMFANAILNESYSNATVTATIDAATGNLVKLVVKFDIAITAQKILGTINATGTSTVTYSEFKF